MFWLYLYLVIGTVFTHYVHIIYPDNLGTALTRTIRVILFTLGWPIMLVWYIVDIIRGDVK